jgi:hypothetical protein
MEDLANVGRTNRLHEQNETNIIRRLIIKKGQALEKIEREPVSAQLFEEKEAIKEDLIRFEIALLPNETLCEIFTVVALDHGPVEFPILPNKLPPQLVLSHVCSRWRTVTLCIPELWNNTVTRVPNSVCRHSEVLDSFNRAMQLNRQWILRAGDIPVALSLHLRRQCDGVLERILSPIKLKKLHLSLVGDYQVTELCGLPDTAFPNLEELSLTLELHRYYDCNFDKPFFTRLRSLTFSAAHAHGYLNDLAGFFERISLPWHQLERFGFLFSLDCFRLPIITNL